MVVASCLHLLNTAPTPQSPPRRWTQPCGYADTMVITPSAPRSGFTMDAVITKLKDQSKRAATSAREVRQAIEVRCLLFSGFILVHVWCKENVPFFFVKNLQKPVLPSIVIMCNR